ncbi:hypothetical protein T4A_1514 [Trichinella pseudospiralis]|uniref:Uncharacterized protein n=1 Tax=Trichinella pseudospiralis TaxID=6337 RepID=A0A0V1ERH2_TRIPS|nr:hypothetical protein T4A_1514 [Trichinella pseudospiralis]
MFVQVGQQRLARLCDVCTVVYTLCLAVLLFSICWRCDWQHLSKGEFFDFLLFVKVELYSCDEIAEKLTEHIEGKVACFDQFTSIIIVFSFDGGVFCHFISANMKMIIFTLDRFACKRSVYYDLRQMLFPQLRCTRKESCAQYKHLYNLVKMKKALQRLNLKKFFTTLNGNVEFNLVDQQLVIL